MDARKAAPWSEARRTLARPLSRRAVWLTLTVMGVSALVAGGDVRAAAPVKLTKYAGIHPLAPHAGEFCYIDLLHVHAQAPSDMRAYRVLPDQRHVFVGDEAAMGYEGAKHAYFGPHPLTVAGAAPQEPLYCYLRGAHFHAAPPTPAAAFVMKDGVFWYTGPFAPSFERDRFNVWVNDVRPIAAYRPPPVELAAAPKGYQLPAAVTPAVPALPAAAPPPATGSTSRTKGAGISPAGKAKAKPTPAATEGATP